MKFSRLIALAAVFGLLAASAQAQTTAVAGTHNKLGGTPPRNPAPMAAPATPATAVPATTAAAPAPAAAPAATWTKADVNNLCSARFSGKPKRIRTCVSRQGKHIGTPKTAQDIQMIQTGQSGGNSPKMKK